MCFAPTTTGHFAAIEVRAHDVQYGFGVVSYDGGTITGLQFAREHHVFADDPMFAGGAVTYVAKKTDTAGDWDYPAKADGRYYVGKVTTPADGGGDAQGGEGGGGLF